MGLLMTSVMLRLDYPTFFSFLHAWYAYLKADRLITPLGVFILQEDTVLTVQRTENLVCLEHTTPVYNDKNGTRGSTLSSVANKLIDRKSPTKCLTFSSNLFYQ